MTELTKLTTDASYKEIAERVKYLDEVIKGLDKETSGLKKERDYLKQEVLPEKMDADDLQTVNVKGVGRISVRQEMRCSTKAEYKQPFQQWLRSIGADALITETVNASTMKAFIKERIQQGEDYPEEMLNLHCFQQAVITKA